MNDDMQAALRQMAGQIGELTSTVRSLETNWRNQDENASNGRAQLHQKVDDLRNELRGLKGKVETVIGEVADMKPVVDGVKTARERAIGVLWVSRVFYAIGLVLSAGFTWIASNWIKVTIR